MVNFTSVIIIYGKMQSLAEPLNQGDSDLGKSQFGNVSKTTRATGGNSLRSNLLSRVGHGLPQPMLPSCWR